MPFVELDREIEREAGTSLNEILLLHGQAATAATSAAPWCDAEEHADGVVIATGGSIVSEPATFDLLQSHFYPVWLKASPEEHMARVVAQGDTAADGRPRGDGRPGRARRPICRILKAAKRLYARDAAIDTAGEASAVPEDLEAAAVARQALPGGQMNAMTEPAAVRRCGRRRTA